MIDRKDALAIIKRFIMQGGRVALNANGDTFSDEELSSLAEDCKKAMEEKKNE